VTETHIDNHTAYIADYIWCEKL